MVEELIPLFVKPLELEGQALYVLFSGIRKALGFLFEKAGILNSVLRDYGLQFAEN